MSVTGNRACYVVWAAALAFALSVEAGSSAQGSFFDPPSEDGSAALDPSGIYPSGQMFPLSLYSLLPQDLPAAREAYMPLVGPYYGGTSAANLTAQDTAVALGLRFIQQIVPSVTFDDTSPDRLAVLDDARKTALRAQIRLQMASTLAVSGRNENLYAWSVHPEELRPWRKIEMDYLQFFVDVVRATDREYGNTPRPVLLYNPNHRLVDQLTTLGRPLDILLKGAYVNNWASSASSPSPDPVEPRPWIRWAMDSIITASGALEHRPIPFIALELSQDPPNIVDRHPETIRRWVRHGVYLSLVRGARGILVWSGWRPRPTLRQTFDYWFDGYRSTAADLNGPLQLGKIFLFGQRRQDIAATIHSGPTTVSYKGPDGVAQTDPSVVLADIAFGTTRYLVAVNSAATSVTVRFGGLPSESVNSLRLFDGQLDVVQESFEYTFQPYEVAAWQFTASDTSARWHARIPPVGPEANRWP